MAVVILLLLWEGVEFRGGRFRGLWEKGGLGEASCFNQRYEGGGERSGGLLKVTLPCL